MASLPANPAEVGLPKRFRDWTPVRKAFLDEPERPTYAELAERFSIPINSVCSVASEEGWALTRSRRLERALADSDVADVLVSAARGERMITDKFRELALVVVAALVIESGQLPAKQAGRVRVLQALTFSALNMGQALKAVGVIGLPKELRDRLDSSASAGDGDGFKRALMNLNVMVQAGGKVSVSTGAAANETAAEKPAQVVDAP